MKWDFLQVKALAILLVDQKFYRNKWNILYGFHFTIAAFFYSLYFYRIK